MKIIKETRLLLKSLRHREYKSKFYASMRFLFVAIIFFSGGACSEKSSPQKESQTVSKQMENKDTSRIVNDLPEHLKRRPNLYIRKGDQIVEASEQDISVANEYSGWPDKGSIFDGKRLTILADKSTYQVNEEIRVIHVVEVVEPGHEVYVMGPKRVYGEHVDDKLITKPLPEDWEDPLVPPLYDGAVLVSPAVDYNYDITSYTFSEPGIHQIYWKLGALQSNTLILKITNATERSEF